MNNLETLYGKKIEGPAFFSNESEFYKIFISMIKIISKGDYEDATFWTIGFRILLHEYLALVLNGEMEPFTLDKEFIDRNKATFRDLINYENEMLQKAGVPLKEGKDGKVEIDIEEMKRRVNGEA